VHQPKSKWCAVELTGLEPREAVGGTGLGMAGRAGRWPDRDAPDSTATGLRTERGRLAHVGRSGRECAIVGPM
jgi:hypothetical protein